MKIGLRRGLYWCDYHRNFYHWDGKTLERCVNQDHYDRSVPGWEKSQYWISEFRTYGPVWIGTF